MKPVRTFPVVPSLPSSLEPLQRLAYNLSWAWHHDALELFLRLDREVFEETEHNPVLMLGTVDQAKLAAAVNDEGFLAHMERVSQNLETYQAGESTWFARTYGVTKGPLIAYFSAEFGVTESLSIFAGGLGLLAGDHLKSASDLGIPMLGVGLMYQQGYFRQRLNDAGRQQEFFDDNDFYNLPLTLERHPDGRPIVVVIDYPERPVQAQIWRAQVGRIPLYLLDTNVPANQPADRAITNQLYGGDREMRLKQEIILGIGGYRALRALGLDPPIYHMNEGHSAFLSLERLLHLMRTQGLAFDQAREAAAAGLVFTSHTPVAAGHDYFPQALMETYFGDYARGLGLGFKDFLALGRQNPDDDGEPFCMTVLALRLAAASNGVSKLHGQITRRMWQRIWPEVPEDDVPVGHVTNGVHTPSWISHEVDQLYERYLGPRWREEPSDSAVWQAIDRLPAEELWRTHERRRERLVRFARTHLRAQLQRRGASPSEVDEADEVLDPEALTIGFSRRFATYKRGTLVLRDPTRLGRILADESRPVQIIFAGKAHPQDEAGKELIRQIVTLSQEERFRGRIVFLEDYGLNMARYLVQGSDVWLNTPLRPLEASGTSGMKAAANGGLHLSTLDGWWDEAWRRPRRSATPIGWAIGNGQIYPDTEVQDRLEAEALYDLLEQDVVPTFFDRGPDGLPRRWIARMKASIAEITPYFNTHRMVREYTQHFYLPAAARYQRLTADGFARARGLAEWEQRVREGWREVTVRADNAEDPAVLQVGGTLEVTAQVWLPPALMPEDVVVEVYMGRLNSDHDIADAEVTAMSLDSRAEDGTYLFRAECGLRSRSGMHGYTVRVLPHHRDLHTRFLPGLITWAVNGE